MVAVRDFSATENASFDGAENNWPAIHFPTRTLPENHVQASRMSSPIVSAILQKFGT
jgi:hypothetical protein